MTLVRYSKRPGDFFTNQLMNQLFRETQDSFRSVMEKDFMPGTNVIEDDNNYIIEMPIPGFSKKEVDIKVENGTIKISAEKQDETEDRKYLRREFAMRKLERSFKLSDTINQENISAEVKDGILNIVLPKIAKKEAKIQQIKVK